MPNNYFTFKQFTIYQDKSAFKVGTDGVLLGSSVDVDGIKRILDIGAGTGLIAIMLGQRSDADIVAIEPDYNSYIQCCENVTLCKWNKRIKIEHTDLQSFNPANDKFDLIVSNPPYFHDSLKNADPVKAASRHNDSLSTDEILNGVSRLLVEEGRFYLIMPYVEGNVFIAAAQEYDLYCNSILKIRPLPSSEIRRMVLGFGKRKTKTTEKFLTIERGKRHDFTDEYISLTKDFYLKF
jgi:tRNA1Val (adenine37-N6)-methyltransferase